LQRGKVIRSTMADAAGVAYSGVRAIHFNEAQYRRDIGRVTR
jgi:phosphoribosylamine-glycine ligase